MADGGKRIWRYNADILTGKNSGYNEVTLYNTTEKEVLLLLLFFCIVYISMRIESKASGICFCKKFI